MLMEWWNAQYNWFDGSILWQLPFWVWDFVRLLAAREFTFSTARNYCVDLYSWLFIFLREFRKCLHKFLVRETIECVHALTAIAHTTMADLSTLDSLLSFNTDLSFWVCNNSTTGHICNNRRYLQMSLSLQFLRLVLPQGFQHWIWWVLLLFE